MPPALLSGSGEMLMVRTVTEPGKISLLALLVVLLALERRDGVTEPFVVGMGIVDQHVSRHWGVWTGWSSASGTQNCPIASKY